MSILKGVLKFLLSLFMPVILIAAGGGLAVLGIEQEWNWLFWFGLIVFGAGIVWGAILFLWADSGSFLD
ncbi:MAG: hypothetical protein AAF216_12675 [Pseudomonadota bacterium]